MKNRSQNESTDLQMAISDVIELLELSKYLTDSPNPVLSKLIARSSNSTCANLIEVILKDREVKDEKRSKWEGWQK